MSYQGAAKEFIDGFTDYLSLFMVSMDFLSFIFPKKFFVDFASPSRGKPMRALTWLANLVIIVVMAVCTAILFGTLFAFGGQAKLGLDMFAVALIIVINYLVHNTEWCFWRRKPGETEEKMLERHAHIVLIAASFIAIVVSRINEHLS